MIDARLVDFIKKELKNGHSEEFLRQGLLTKGWPLDIVDDSIKEAKRQTTVEAYLTLAPKIETPTVEEVKRISDRPIIHKSRFDRYTLTISIVMFLVIAIIISFTSLVFFYMQGVMDYKIFDPVTGQTLSRQCVFQNCSDLRDFAIDFAKTKILTSLIIGLVTSISIVIIYNLISFKKVFLWVIQALFLLFLLFMGFTWFRFTRMPL